MRRFILGCALWAFATLSAACSANTCSSTPYAQDFRQAGAKHFPALDWLWLAAQARQESAFDRFAVSHAGARGLMQIMPATWAEETAQMRLNCSPWSARCSIMVGTRYDRKMARIWAGRERTLAEQVPLMLASYNAGAGRVIKAQAKAGNPRRYAEFADLLPPETQVYVIRVNGYYWDYKKKPGSAPGE